MKAVDNAGNADASPASFTWSVDTTAPQTQIDTHPAALTNAAAANFTFSGTDTGGSGLGAFECRLDSNQPGAWASCTSPRELSGLGEGSHTFEVRAVDQAGNADQSPASFTWSVDTTAPVVTIDSGPAGVTNNPTPTFAFSSEAGASFECSIDTGTPDFGPCSGAGTHTPDAPLPDGPYTFRVRATDAASNQATTTRGFQIDTASPQAPQLTATIPASPANDNSPKLVGSAISGATVRIYAGASCSGSPIATVSAAGLEAGVTVAVADDSTTSFSATATTAAENTSGCSEPLTYKEDSTAPTTQIDTHPAALTNSAAANFTFSGTDTGGSGVGAFECRLDAGAWATCTSPRELSGLGDGSHTFEVRAVDNAGNADQSPASFAWSVDTTAPSVTIDSLSKSLLGAGETSEVSWHANENGAFSLRVGGADCDSGTVIDSGAYGSAPAGQSSEVDAADLSEGANTLRLCLSDAAGNRGQATRTITKDTTAPTTQIDTHPLAIAPSNSASFTFSGTDAGGSGVGAFECRLDAGAWASCTSPRELSGLGEGSHTFEVRAVDKAGNADASPASFTWSVDTTAPTTQIDSHPAALTNAAAANFSFSGTDAGGSGIGAFECRLDSNQPGDWASCTSPRELSGLGDGSHTFEVKAVDNAGNADASPASFSWSVDTTAPTTQIDTHPAGARQRRRRQLRLLGHRHRRLGPRRLRMPPRRRRLGDLHLAARTERPRRRLPHFRSESGRQRRQRRCLAGLLQLERRHHRAHDPDRQPSAGDRALELGELRLLGHRHRRLRRRRLRMPPRLRRMGGLLLAAELRRARRGLPQLRSARGRPGRQRRCLAGLLQLERRHHRAADADRHPPGGAHQRRRRQLHLLGHRHGWLGPRRLRMPPRLQPARRLGELHLAARTERPRRGLPHFRSPRGRPGRERRARAPPPSHGASTPPRRW